MCWQCVGRRVGSVSTDALANVFTDASVGSDSLPLPLKQSRLFHLGQQSHEGLGLSLHLLLQLHFETKTGLTFELVFPVRPQFSFLPCSAVLYGAPFLLSLSPFLPPFLFSGILMDHAHFSCFFYFKAWCLPPHYHLQLLPFAKTSLLCSYQSMLQLVHSLIFLCHWAPFSTGIGGNDFLNFFQNLIHFTQ